MVNGADESMINLLVARQMREHLAMADIPVMMTRELDKSVSWSHRRKVGDQCDLVLSIHVDSGANPLWRGMHFLHWPGNHTASAIATKLAKHTPGALRRASQVYPANDRWPRAAYVVGVFRPTTLVVELGFLTRLEDAQYLSSSAGVHSTALALAAGVADMF